MQISDIARLPETRSGLYLALFSSLVVKVAVLVVLAENPVNNDGILYLAAAEKLAQGDVTQSLALFHLPLFPMLVAAMHWVVPDWLTAARLVTFLALLGALVPLYLTTRDLFGPTAAFFCGLAFAVAPYPNELISQVFRGGTYFFFLAWAVYFAQRAVAAPRTILFLAAALFAGAAALCRVEGVLFIGVSTLFFCICLVFAEPRRRGSIFRGTAAWAAVFMAAVAVVYTLLGPDSASISRLAVELQNVLQGRFLDHYHQIYQQLVLLGKSSPYPSGNQNFAEIARHWMWFIYLLGLLQILVVVIFPPAVIALATGLRHRRTRSSVFLLWTVAWFLFFIYASHVSRDFIQTRFLFAPAYLLYPWVGLGLERIWDRLRGSRWPRQFAVLFVAFFFVAPLANIGLMLARQDPTNATAGRWISSVPELRAANKFFTDAQVAFHADQDWLEFKHNHNLWQTDRRSIESFARAHGFDVVVRQYRRGRKPEGWPDFDTYRQWKVFEGGKDFVEVFAAPHIGSPPVPVAAGGDRLVQ